MNNFKKLMIFSLFLSVSNNHSMQQNNKAIGLSVAAVLIAGGAGTYLYLSSNDDDKASFWYKCGWSNMLYRQIFDACEKKDLERVKHLSSYVDDINEMIREKEVAVNHRVRLSGLFVDNRNGEPTYVYAESLEKAKDTLLGIACEKNCFDIVKYLVEEKNADINLAGINPNSDFEDVPLIRACSKQVREYLFKKGAGPHLKFVDGTGMASFNFDIFENPALIAQEAINRGYAVDRRSKKRLTPLMQIGDNVPVAECFISNGADVNAKDNEGLTPLFWANQNGAYNVANLLISNGASLGLSDKDKHLQYVAMLTILYHANVGFLDYVLTYEHCNINMQRERSGSTVLHDFASQNFSSWAQSHDIKRNPASDLTDKELVLCLLSRGADPEIKDVQGKKPFEYAQDNEVRAILKDPMVARKALIGYNFPGNNVVNTLNTRQLTGNKNRLPY
ncbi:MAG TPA: ankyrin repeat domain-containing protein [Candidatus Babeliales bacterium]|nr:ankyrin repeat domain-containing protein [Candidatus Babeliales bacterium]